MLPKCSNCGIEIRWQPTVVDARTYCCIGCSQGGPCTCDYEHLPAKGARVSLARRVIVVPLASEQGDQDSAGCSSCRVSID